jgi:hypothetical protein
MKCFKRIRIGCARFWEDLAVIWKIDSEKRLFGSVNAYGR